MRSLFRDVRAVAGRAALIAAAMLLAAPSFAQDYSPPAADQEVTPPETSAPSADSALTEDVVAHVNDEVITNYDVEQRLRLLVATAGIQPTRNDIPQLEQYALESLIDERLEMQELKHEEKEQKFTIIATDAVVDDAISDMAKQNHMTAQQFLDALAQRGIGAETLRSQVRAQLSWQDWIRGRYGSRLRIGDDQIKAFQERMASEAAKPKYQISEIFIDSQKAGGEQQAQDEATQLIAQLHQGASFQAVARQFSASSTAANGGDDGWVTAGELDPQVRAAIEDMRPGSLSAPIAVKDGVYIIYLRQKQAGGSELLISLKQAAIPLPPNAPQDQVDAARAKLEALRGKLHGCDDFVSTANKDTGVMAGDLGEAAAKDLAPAFRDAAMSLGVGQISEPIRSDEGLHLIVVCSRRSNSAQGLTRDQIADRLMGEQLEMINKREIRDLRNSASIEIAQSQSGS